MNMISELVCTGVLCVVDSCMLFVDGRTDRTDGTDGRPRDGRTGRDGILEIC